MYRILVPLDGSALAESAIAPACAIARDMKGQIELFLAHVPELFVVDDAAVRGRTPRALETEYLQRAAEQAAADWGVPVTYIVVKGDPTEKISDRAKQLSADLIVMTTHGRTGFSRAWIGSVADGVVRSSKTPVLLIRARENTSSSAPSLRHFLVALDGSTPAESILDPLLAHLATKDLKLTLAQVVRPVPQMSMDPVIPYAVTSPIIDQDATAEVVSEAKAYLMGVAARVIARREAAIEPLVVVNEHPATAILGLVEAVHADAIAMTTHGRGASRLLVGSVADKVLRGTTVPLLLYRPRVPKTGRGTDRSARRVKKAPARPTLGARS
jgi:nucleotide-binding universal stress UspA family protein